jgi:ABC-type phosphate/phosphonate transport system ATPase subunit
VIHTLINERRIGRKFNQIVANDRGKQMKEIKNHYTMISFGKTLQEKKTIVQNKFNSIFNNEQWLQYTFKVVLLT